MRCLLIIIIPLFILPYAIKQNTKNSDFGIGFGWGPPCYLVFYHNIITFITLHGAWPSKV